MVEHRLTEQDFHPDLEAVFGHFCLCFTVCTQANSGRFHIPHLGISGFGREHGSFDDGLWLNIGWLNRVFSQIFGGGIEPFFIVFYLQYTL